MDTAPGTQETLLADRMLKVWVKALHVLVVHDLGFVGEDTKPGLMNFDVSQRSANG